MIFDLVQFSHTDIVVFKTRSMGMTLTLLWSQMQTSNPSYQTGKRTKIVYVNDSVTSSVTSLVTTNTTLNENDFVTATDCVFGWDQGFDETYLVQAFSDAEYIQEKSKVWPYEFYCKKRGKDIKPLLFNHSMAMRNMHGQAIRKLPQMHTTWWKTRRAEK